MYIYTAQQRTRLETQTGTRATDTEPKTKQQQHMHSHDTHRQHAMRQTQAHKETHTPFFHVLLPAGEEIMCDFRHLSLGVVTGTKQRQALFQLHSLKPSLTAPPSTKYTSIGSSKHTRTHIHYNTHHNILASRHTCITTYLHHNTPASQHTNITTTYIPHSIHPSHQEGPRKGRHTCTHHLTTHASPSSHRRLPVQPCKGVSPSTDRVRVHVSACC